MAWQHTYCTLCKREIHDWATHIKSVEHQRASREVLIKKGCYQ